MILLTRSLEEMKLNELLHFGWCTTEWRVHGRKYRTETQAEDRLSSLGVISGGLQRAPVPQSLLSQHRKNSVRGKVIESDIQIGCLVRLISRQARERHPENLVGYSFIKGKAGRGKRPPSSSFFHHQPLLQVGQRSFLIPMWSSWD